MSTKSGISRQEELILLRTMPNHPLWRKQRHDWNTKDVDSLLNPIEAYKTRKPKEEIERVRAIAPTKFKVARFFNNEFQFFATKALPEEVAQMDCDALNAKIDKTEMQGHEYKLTQTQYSKSMIMKKLLTLTAIFFSFLAQSQTTVINVLGNTNAAQVEIERVEDGFYYKAYLEHSFAENFNNAGFAVGYSTHFDKFETYRFYAGIKIGALVYDQVSNFNAVPGLETGIDYNLSEKFSLGVRYVADWREDLKFYGINYEPSLKGSVFGKLTFKIN